MSCLCTYESLFCWCCLQDQLFLQFFYAKKKAIRYFILHILPQKIYPTEQGRAQQFKGSNMVSIRGFLLLGCLLHVHVRAQDADAEEPIVTTKYGRVRGTTLTTRNGESFLAFRGIPYAKPPIGSLRFKSPQEPAPWTDILDATNDGNICMQQDFLFSQPWTDILDATNDGNICMQQDFLFSQQPQIEGSEDCLYLNVYTPSNISTLRDAADQEESLPVMIAFHYGAFISGSASSDVLGPEYLLDKNVILVTFNYRLGIFGFFSTYDDAAPGNWGFKDQVAAMKWVRDNIEKFGGNPQKVTIFGASAGAGSVHHHILSPRSKGLFQAAITQSGSALALWAQPQRETALVVAKVQADVVGCNSSVGTDVMVECLRRVPAKQLVESLNLFRFMRSEPLTVYLPTIEVESPTNPEPFITRNPIDVIEDADFSNVPWIIGVTSSEGILRAAPFIRQTDLLDAINAHFNEYFLEMLYLRLSVTDEDLPTTWSKIKQFYFSNDDKIDATNPMHVQGLIDHKGHANIWFYYFDYKGNQPFGEAIAATENQVDFDWGVSHCDDLIYLFKNSRIFPDFELDGKDLEVSELLLNLFTNFAKYHDPTPKDLYETQHRWQSLPSTADKEVIENSDLRYLKISGKYDDVSSEKIGLSTVEEFHVNRMSFWIGLSLKENIAKLT
ncbi:Carboxylesterase family [Popillia japonica]|uniref:Carboxylic ester hydrolase n=1 Tax=Popillia japonica TaxID=7064 RepID=A0AAW1LS60_POPJA